MTKAVLIRHILTACLLVPFALTGAVAAEPVQLITREEAGLPPADGTGGRTRNLTRGPGIDTLLTPGTAVNGRPFRLAVRFMPSNGVPIDPASVRISYRRQTPVDITARVKPYITAAGIDAPAVLVPPGRHHIDIEAADKEGRIGRSRMTLTVEAQP